MRPFKTVAVFFARLVHALQHDDLVAEGSVSVGQARVGSVHGKYLEGSQRPELTEPQSPAPHHPT
jgi:hypothetical protein